MTDLKLKTILTSYFERIKRANVEQAKKEILLGLLRDLFATDKGALDVIKGMEEGSEWRIENIPLHHRRKSGSADTQYRNLIIEFERNMARTSMHAADQLAEYVAGNIISGMIYEYTLIATDGITWTVYAPDPRQIAVIENTAHVDRNFLIEIDRFVVSDNTLRLFPPFLDRYIFRINPEIATIDSIVRNFGIGSATYFHSVHELRQLIDASLPSLTELSVAFREWETLLRIAYGSYEGDTHTFAVHTYLSMLSKLLAYEVLTQDQYIDDTEVKKVLNGTIFHAYNVLDFVERDFFGWINDIPYSDKIAMIASRIASTLSDLDFRDVHEDVLKGVYQSLIDVKTRHDLGEYYTPDWLCELIVNDISPMKDAKMIDPSCGSGSFIRAYTQFLSDNNPDISAEDLAASTTGIDVNPLSVQIAKATKLIAIGTKLFSATKPVSLRIFLANSLYTPHNSMQLFSDSFTVSVNGEQVSISTDMLIDMQSYDELVSICDQLATISSAGELMDRDSFDRIMTKSGSREIQSTHLNTFYTLYRVLRDSKVRSQDSIWKFILQNAYKPAMLGNSFDYVLGNPPWLTYSQIDSKAYQDIVINLADKYALVTGKSKNIPHLEMATVFVAHCAASFLKDSGRGAFVMPRSIFSADHHSRFREGKSLGFNIDVIWDLNDVTNLFPVPSCVVYFRTDDSIGRDEQILNNVDTSISNVIFGKSFNGVIPRHNMQLSDALAHLKERNVNWRLKRVNKKSAWSEDSNAAVHTHNSYYEQFRQGAAIVPRALFFVESENFSMLDVSHDQTIHVQTSQYATNNAKEPWTNIQLEGYINSKRIYLTFLANRLLPYCSLNPLPVVLPADVIPVDEHISKIELRSSEDLLRSGDIDAYHWFKQTDDLWIERRTQTASKFSLIEYLDYNGKLTGQTFNQDGWYVFYNASGRDACACIVSMAVFKRPIVFDAKTYWAHFADINEAYYVLAHINSIHTNSEIKDFQSRGLFGARDIHKLPLDIQLNRFVASNPTHLQIVALAMECERVAFDYLRSESILDIARVHELGRVRNAIRNAIMPLLKEIDTLFDSARRM